MGEEISKKREMEAAMLDKASQVISTINNATHVDQVICTLHSLASLLFPIDPSLISGSIDESYREQVLGVKVHSAEERADMWQAFYQGIAFPTFARFLLFDVASNWLTCFPFSAKKHVYDVFFVHGFIPEVVQILALSLQRNGSDGSDVNSVLSNSERLLVLCLIDHKGVLQLATEFGGSYKLTGHTHEQLKADVSRVAQIVASIPDKARANSLTSLSSHSFFRQIIIQLLSLAEERDVILQNRMEFGEKGNNGALIFIGELFTRICRRGSADLLSSEVIPRVLSHVQSCLLSHDSLTEELLESNPDSTFWFRMMDSIRDPYTVERISEQFLYKLASRHANDIVAYWVLWLLFQRTFKHQASVRSLFVDKFLLWKVFPFSCLKWILQFAVHACPPGTIVYAHSRPGLLNVVQRLVAVWSKKEFVQTASIEQHAYISAALGLLLETLTKEELDGTKDVMHLILQGVSCRLESPNTFVRRTASTVALVLSKVIDPKNPLYLDDSCSGETIDWEFGLNVPKKVTIAGSNCREKDVGETKMLAVSDPDGGSGSPSNSKSIMNRRGKKKLLEFNVLDPDEIIDPASLNLESDSGIDDNDMDDSGSEDSNSSDNSSLQPYNLADDDSDLKKRISQLTDVVAALRKTDDVDGVERAIDVAESLIRASPDELKHMAGDLARTLVYVRCSDISVEGEEESTEEKRQKALVALLVTSPFESLDTLSKLIYSPNLDISQRIMILDVMTESAQELAEMKVMKSKHKSGSLISFVSDTQPWFLPSNAGPPGAGSWKEISRTETLLNWSNSYERELPSKNNQIKKGKTRRWSLGLPSTQQNMMECSQNKFPVYAAAFMLPVMEGFDKKRHGVDLLDRDFIVLGKLIHMLGVCMKSLAMHPEASALAPPLLDMLRSREVCQHKEAYVRRAVLFSAACILIALHPTFIATSMLEGNADISAGLDWIRTWALEVAESDTDRECYMMAIKCIQLHGEMALQTSRALESTKSSFKTSPALPSNTSKMTIKIPFLNGN